MPKKLPPLHPGESCARNSSCRSVCRPGRCKGMGVPRTRVERIAAESTG